MEFECKLSKTEVREAYRMNQSWRFWMMTIRHNLYPAVFAVVIVVGVVTSIAENRRVDWESTAIAVAFEGLIVAFYWWRVTYRFKKMAAKANAECERMVVDARGIATSTSSGSTTFSPWSQFKRWKEGKLVFTLSDGKTFRTIPKSAIGEIQAGEVRGILQTQIR